jgi:hypothetical protein
MAVRMDWDTFEREIIRVTFIGEWDVDDIHRMFNKRDSMMETVTHPVHQILDMTASTSWPDNLLSVRSRAELPANQKGNLILVVNPGNYILSVANIMQALAPSLFEGVHFVNSIDEAYAKISEKTGHRVG